MHLRPAGKALGKAPLTEAAEIGVAVGLPGGELEARQMVVAELEIVAAARGDLRGVVRGLGVFGEERAHLLLALEVELLRLEAHAVGLLEGLAGLDAQQHVLRGVGFLDIVRVVGEREGDAGVTVEADELARGALLLLDAVILDLEIEVLLAEGLPQHEGALFGALVFVVDQRLRDLAREAAGQADQPLGVLGEELPVDAGPDVKALDEALGDQIAEVAVAGLVAAEEDEVGVVVVQAVLLLRAAARGDIDLAADDGLDPLGDAGLIEVHRAVHDAVVGDGEGGLPQLPGALGNPVDAAGAVEQGIFGMDM